VAGQGDATMVHHRLTSNDVVVGATYVQASPPVRPPHGPSSPPRHAHQGTPPPGRPAQGAPPVKASGVLPNTGGPQWWYLPTGAGLVLLGAGVLLGRGGRRRREV
jgi:LPXTG-motif cell wall-anchored protein